MRRQALAALILVLAAGALRAAGTDPELALADRIDQLVEEQLRGDKVQPAPLADDAEYLRRVCLDLIGRIPSVAETRTFLADPAPDKRRRLVQKLLKSSEFVDHFTNVWRDLLLPEANADLQLQGQLNGFNDWLRKQIAGNAGYDRLVRELLTTPFSSPRLRPGRMAPRPQQTNEPSALAFYLAKDVKPENLASSTARIFLGVRLDCAQCHDHPSGLWTRQQFWSYAAFFAGLQRDPAPDGGAVRELFDRRELRIPGSVQAVEARFLDGTEPQWGFNTGARTTLAAWVTSADNPYFARATVNRVWAYLFGIGLVEPVDDLRPTNPASHPELLDELARQLAAQHFDLRFLIRTLTATRAYQRASAAPSQAGKGPDGRLFSHKALKALTPEQIFATLVRATGYKEPTARQQDAPAPRRIGLRDQVMALFRRQGQSPTEVQMSIQQALTLMNSPQMAEAIHCKGGTVDLLAGASGDATERVETLFLAALTRRPTKAEQARFMPYVAQKSGKQLRAALGDVLWVLLNSTEGLVNH
jgi:hypothetical protein